jgi:hypothetical protein
MIFLLIAAFALLLVQCGEEDNNPVAPTSTAAKTTFSLTQDVVSSSQTAPKQYQITESYKFKCIDRTTPSCVAYQFIDHPNHDSGDWMGFPKSDYACGFFFAQVAAGATYYEFYSEQFERIFGQSAGPNDPFVRGTYQKYDPNQPDDPVVETGTFTWHEGNLKVSSNPGDCSM